MNTMDFHHIGGAIVTDHGRLSLVAARALSRFYRTEAVAHGLPGHSPAQLSQRVLALDRAIDAAMRWRRAAGWVDPDLADEACC